MTIDEMRMYVGADLVSAKPMAWCDYAGYRGWSLPADKDGPDKGYFVRESDGSNAWYPAATFEVNYQLVEKGVTSEESE